MTALLCSKTARFSLMCCCLSHHEDGCLGDREGGAFEARKKKARLSLASCCLKEERRCLRGKNARLPLACCCLMKALSQRQERLPFPWRAVASLTR